MKNGKSIKRFLKAEWEKHCDNMFGIDWRKSNDFLMYYNDFNRTIDEAFRE